MAAGDPMDPDEGGPMVQRNSMVRRCARVWGVFYVFLPHPEQNREMRRVRTTRGPHSATAQAKIACEVGNRAVELESHGKKKLAAQMYTEVCTRPPPRAPSPACAAAACAEGQARRGEPDGMPRDRGRPPRNAWRCW